MQVPNGHEPPPLHISWNKKWFGPDSSPVFVSGTRAAHRPLPWGSRGYILLSHLEEVCSILSCGDLTLGLKGLLQISRWGRNPSEIMTSFDSFQKSSSELLFGLLYLKKKPFLHARLLQRAWGERERKDKFRGACIWPSG